MAAWTDPIDLYCERTSAALWAEPLNAVSNLAFLLAAAAAYRLWRGRGGEDHPALALIIVTALVGIGSLLFHTVANRWSLMADVIPIGIFIYGYLLLAFRRYLGWGLPAALVGLAAFAAVNTRANALWGAAFGPGSLAAMNGSVSYLAPALALIVVGGFLLVTAREMPRRRAPGQALVAAAGVFALSLLFRTIDQAVCAAAPFGTHYAWHALNAVVLFLLLRAAIRFGPALSR